MKKRKVITSLGLGRYSDVIYYKVMTDPYTKQSSVKDTASATPYIAKAIMDFYPEFDEYYFLLTKEVQGSEHFKEIRGILETNGKEVHVETIKPGKYFDDIWHIFNTLGGILGENDEIIFDITHGFRSIPFLAFSVLRFYEKLKNIKIKSVIYGAFDARTDDEPPSVPVFDLLPVLRVLDFKDGVINFLRFYNTEIITQALKEKDREVKKQLYHPISKLASHIKNYAQSALISQTIDMSSGASTIIKDLEEIMEKTNAEIEQALPLPIVYLFSLIQDDLKKIAIDSTVLSEDLIKKDLHIAREYINRGLYQPLYTLLREVLVDIVILFWLGEVDEDIYLDRNKRLEAEKLLNVNFIEQGRGIEFITDKKEMKKAIKDLTSLWNRIAEKRNAINHAGRNKESQNIFKRLNDHKLIEDIAKALENDQIKSAVKEVLEKKKVDQGKLLITPLGLSKGLLYTALKKVNPENLIVITSESISGDTIEEIIEKSQVRVEEKEVFRVKDPYTDFDLWKKIITSDRLIKLSRNKEIYFNITGGTTALQYNLQKLLEYFKYHIKLLPIKVIVCIDRRPAQEQRNNPFVEGEIKFIEESDKGDIKDDE